MSRPSFRRRLSVLLSSAVLVTSGLTIAAAPPVALAAGPISLTALGSTYTQDFNTLASSGTSSTVPTGWEFVESGTNANLTYSAGTGSGNAGDTYSFGDLNAVERAFGGLLSGSLTPTTGAQFGNNTGGIITSLAVTYTGEMWRAGVTNRNAHDRLDFQLSTNAPTLTTGTWVDYDSLDFSSPNINTNAGALNGNAAGNRTLVSSTITGLSIAEGASFWIRWSDFNITNSDDGLAIDDFSITPAGFVPDPAPTVSTTTPASNAIDVALTSNLAVAFSESVNVGSGAFDLACVDSGAHPVAISGGPTEFTLDPGADFANSETCTLTINAALVSDQDANDPYDTMVSNYVTSFTTIGPDNAPTVTSTVPADGATNVALAQNVVVNFSEPVNVTDPWFTLTCVTSGTHPASVTGGPTSYTLNPTADFVYGESCTLVIDASKISDQDSNDPPDTMIINFVVGFTTEPDPCTLSYTPIYTIQGNGPLAAVTGAVTTQGVVVADFEGSSPALRGFYLQDLNGDGDATTSDGLFVFNGNNNSVSVGDVVRVSGTASDFNAQTQVSATTIRKCGTAMVQVTEVTLPFASADTPERYEGMLVNLTQPLVISEYFNYDRFGEIVLALPLDGETRPFTGTNIDEPGPAANARTAANALRRITLDDNNTSQNPSVLRHPNGNPFSLANRFRGGDTVGNTVGVMGFAFSLYRIFPTGPADYAVVNPRPATPDAVSGTVRVAAMNTLNFFVTADYPTGNPLDNKCGPANNVECRGWDSDQATEFTRQRDKLLTALTGLNADIIGLNELENSTGVEPLVSITSGMPGYAYIATGTIGTDAIKVGMIYRPAVVTPVGDFKLLDSDADPRFIDTKSRPSLAQTFEVNATGARFTVVVNHLKSKGSDCLDVGDPDLLDGQGNCSQTRRLAAEAMVDWLATDPTGSGDPDFIIVGDLNSYAMEDTIDAIKEGADDVVGTSDDYTNLIARFQGAFAYSYTFDGQAGYLDHALANASFLDQITGATEWHINSDEPDVLDYDTSFKPAAQDALYEVNPYRTSDHDPVIVGLTPNAPPTVNASFSGAAIECGAANGTLSIEFTDPDAADTHEIVIDWGDGTTQTIDPATSPLTVPHTYDAAGQYAATVTVTDDHGYSDSVTVPVTVKFTSSGILQPINSFGTSVFKYGSTIPVKVVFTDCDGSIPTDLAPKISVTMVSGNPPGWNLNEPISTSAADTGGVMRFSDGKWIYNLATRPLPDPTGTYEITITVPETGQTLTATFGLRP